MTTQADRLSQLAGVLGSGGMLPSSQITGGGGGHSHTWSEVPSGAIDGVNAIFTLAAIPAAGSLLLFRNGLLMRAGAGNDYTLVAAVVTFPQGNLPQSGDIVLASYQT